MLDPAADDDPTPPLERPRHRPRRDADRWSRWAEGEEQGRDAVA